LARAVGLDVGARHVRLVEADGGARALRVVRLGEREVVVPEGGSREDAVRDAVDALFRDTRASRDEVVLTWPAEACVLREITVPFRDQDQIRKVVKFEFESHVHGRDIEEVVVDFVSTGDTREGTRLLCAGAEKGPLRALLQALDRVKVDPVAVDLDATCLVAGLAAAGVLLETPTAVVADIGTRSTKIALLVDGKVRSVRSFRGGFESLDGAPLPRPDDLLAVPGAAAPSEAPAAERSAASLEVAVVQDRRTDVLGRLSREMSRTLAQAGTGTSFPVLLVTGRGSRVPGLRETLAAALGMEVRPLGLLSRVPGPVPPEMMEEADATYAAALGAAARALGASPAPLDLRREDLAYARRFDQVKGALAVGLGLLLLGTGFLLWRAKTEMNVAQADYRTLSSAVQATASKVEETYKADLGDEPFLALPKVDPESLAALPGYRARADAMYGHLRNEMGLSTEVPPIVSSLEMFRAVQGAVASVREKIEYCLVTTESYSQRGADVTLVLSASEHVDVVAEAFRSLKSEDRPLFAEVNPGTVQMVKGKFPVSFALLLEKKGGR